MVYRLTKMRLKTKFLFFITVWLFSVVVALLGAVFITTAAIIPNTPYIIDENELIHEIREDMGDWQQWDYFNEEDGNYYGNINIVAKDDRLEASTTAGDHIPEFRKYRLIEVRENGRVSFLWGADLLIFDIFNQFNVTTYEVFIGFPEALWIDIDAHQLVPSYQPQKDFPIFGIEDSSAATNQTREILGDYFVVRNRPFSDWLNQIFIELQENFINEFIFVGRLLLTTVAIGGGASIITALIITFLRIVRISGSRFWTYTLLKRLNGRFGRLISIFPIFDFAGETYVEESFVNDINLSGTRSTLKELFRQRGYDILFFPTALAAILTIIFVQNFKAENKLIALVWSPILSPLVLLVLLFYFPAIWSFNEGGFKRLEISPQGDILSVKPLGKILRDGTGILVGFSGIFSLGALAVQVTRSFAGTASSSGAIQVAGFTLDLFGLSLLVLWTVGLFLILLASIVVGASLIAINYLETTHLNTIEQMRTRAEKDQVINNFGSITTRFKPMATETIYSKENS
ncbi:MAG: hypothetical protein ACW99F_07840 [Candidatus Hodarchaeales archaeon]|jgi:hypothetical protein